MYFFIFLIVGVSQVFAGPLNSSESVPAPKRLQNTNDVECGGVVTCNSGYIVFSPFGNIPPNKRCQYVISVPSANQYVLKTVFAGFISSNYKKTAGLVFSTINFDEEGVASFEVYEVNQPATFAAQAVLVTFYSVEGSESGGFIIQYEASTITGSSSILPVSKHSEYSTLKSGETHRHPSKMPVGPDDFAHRELSIISLEPPKNILNPDSRMEAEYEKLTPSESTFCSVQKVEYFSFNRHTGRYVSRGQICDEVTNKRMLLQEATILIVKSSRSYSDPKRAFKITYYA